MSSRFPPFDTESTRIRTTCPLAVVARYAAHLLGATIVHLPAAPPMPDAPHVPLNTQSRIVTRAGVDLLLADGQNTDRAASVVALAGVFGALDGSAEATKEPPPEVVRVPEPAIVTFTSGSTGEPKGVVEDSAGHNARVLESYPMLGDVPPVYLVTRPLNVSSASPFVDVALHRGGHVVLPEVIDATSILRAIADEEVTATSMSVPDLYAVLDHPDLPDTDVSSVAHLLYTGYPAAPERLAEATKYFGKALMQGYGATSASWTSRATCTWPAGCTK